jgi:hypothetical protein
MEKRITLLRGCGMTEQELRLYQLCATSVLGAMAGLIALQQVLIARRQAETAKQQAKTAADKLKLDLYDRRYDVYLAVTAWIRDLQKRQVPEKAYQWHMHKIQAVQFLFEKDVKEWVLALRMKARAMNHNRKVCSELREKAQREGELDERYHAEFMEATEKFEALMQEFDKAHESAAEMFSPYLDFSKNL